MGQKVNPKSLRLNLTKKWESRWFAPKKNFSQFLEQDLLIRNHLRKKYPEGAIKEIVVFRNAKNIEITIYTAKPGIIIGRSGQGMNDIRDIVNKVCFKNFNGPKPKVRIHVEDIRNFEHSAYLVAESVAFQIEKRIPPRKALKKALEKITEKGIKGAKIKVSGRLNGAEIARSEMLGFGSIPLHSIKMNIDYAYVQAITTYGTIGVKVWINLGEFARDQEEQKEELENERRKNR